MPRYADLALSYFEHALNVDLLNLHGNSADGVHVASTGGVWAALVYGFGGLRDDTGEWLFDPRLPVGWDGLEFSLRREDASVHFVLTADVFTASLRRGELEITFWVRGVSYTLSPEHPQCSIALDDQGPVLQGEPSIEAVYAAQRDDGSPLTSSIKKLTRDEELAIEPPLTIIG